MLDDVADKRLGSGVLCLNDPAIISATETESSLVVFDNVEGAFTTSKDLVIESMTSAFEACTMWSDIRSGEQSEQLAEWGRNYCTFFAQWTCMRHARCMLSCLDMV